MKTSLDHLPEDKQYWIRRTADAIVEMAKPEMLILFGSNSICSISINAIDLS
jgi:hypothetical protein